MDFCMFNKTLLLWDDSRLTSHALKMFLRHGIFCSNPICSLIGLLKRPVFLHFSSINVSNK